jgi:hypothetical protein
LTVESLSELLLAARRKERPPVLIASLPRNDPALAQAALEGGADVIKFHIHLQHRASQTVTGSLAEERPALEQILRLSAGHPVGIVPGADLSAYAAIRRRTRPPLVVPELAAIGIEGVMLGSIVCGTTPQGWYKAFHRFRAKLI